MKTFFQNNWNKILVGLVLVLILFLLPSKCNDNKEVAVQSKDLSDSKLDLNRVLQWQDKFNTLHFLLERTQVENEVLQAHYDSIANVLKIKSKNIQSVAQVKSSISIVKKLNTQTQTDTIGGKLESYITFDYKDNWIDIQGDAGKTDLISIKGTDTLTKVDYSKRKWFFGKKHYYSDFSNKNPYIVIEGLKQVEVKPTIDRWGIGPSIGVSARLGDKVEIFPTVGISLQYNFITF